MPDNKTNQNEFEIKTPQRKNEEITTSDNTRTRRDENKDQNQTQNSNNYGDERKDQNMEKKGIHKEDDEREERINPEQHKSQDTKWQQNKMNEANNQDNENEGVPVDGKGNADKNTKPVDKEAFVNDKNKNKGSLSDTRDDSITNRPKTETYERSEKDKK